MGEPTGLVSLRITGFATALRSNPKIATRVIYATYQLGGCSPGGDGGGGGGGGRGGGGGWGGWGGCLGVWGWGDSCSYRV